MASDKFYMVFKFLNEAVNFKNETFEGKVVCLCAKFFWAWYYLFQTLTEPDTWHLSISFDSPFLKTARLMEQVSIWDHQLHLMDQLSNTWHSYYYLQDCWWAFSDPLLTLLEEQHPQKNSKFILTSYYSYQKLCNISVNLCFPSLHHHCPLFFPIVLKVLYWFCLSELL